jgi:peptidoglycan hydrolase-like protein with peptidoglycan-binding domain
MTKRLVTCFLSIILALSFLPANALATDRYEILKLGDQDEYVEKLQERLLELGFLTGKVTGYFGTVTQQAVMKYQKEKGLTVDGKAGPETLRSLMGKNFKMLPDRLVPKESADEYGPGDRGDEVLKIQQRLKDLEYYEYPTTTGYYGPVTQEAVARFQRTNGMTETGVADAKTTALLFLDNASYYCLSPGDKGSDVTLLQKRLSDLGFLTSDSVTGYFGQVTEQALMEFQAQSGLSVDAKAGKNTRALLYSAAAAAWDGKNRVAGEAVSVKPVSSVKKMLDFARQQVGKKYSYSTEGPSSFDCSGLIYYVLKYMGISTARYSASGFSFVDNWEMISSKSALQPGDLLFFKSDGSNRITHTGIYLKDGEFINASSSDGKVKISSLSGYYDRNFVRARRVSFK